jgi:hypothetical protein
VWASFTVSILSDSPFPPSSPIPLVDFKLICYEELVIGRSNALVDNEGTTLQQPSFSTIACHLCLYINDLLFSS